MEMLLRLFSACSPYGWSPHGVALVRADTEKEVLRAAGIKPGTLKLLDYCVLSRHRIKNEFTACFPEHMQKGLFGKTWIKPMHMQKGLLGKTWIKPMHAKRIVG